MLLCTTSSSRRSVRCQSDDWSASSIACASSSRATSCCTRDNNAESRHARSTIHLNSKSSCSFRCSSVKRPARLGLPKQQRCPEHIFDLTSSAGRILFAVQSLGQNCQTSCKSAAAQIAFFRCLKASYPNAERMLWHPAQKCSDDMALDVINKRSPGRQRHLANSSPGICTSISY